MERVRILDYFHNPLGCRCIVPLTPENIPIFGPTRPQSQFEYAELCGPAVVDRKCQHFHYRSNSALLDILATV